MAGIPKPGDDGRAVLLLSGGMDSSVLLAALRHEGWRVHALTVSYGQRHGIEVEAAREQARVWECEAHEVVEMDARLFRSALTGSGEVEKDRVMEGVPATYVPARNLVLLSMATAWAESIGAGDIFIGANAVDFSGYPDCRASFVEAFGKAAREGTRSGVRVWAPLVEMSKAGIVRLGEELGVDLEATHSCYDPVGGKACGRCDACRLRRKGFEEAGIEDRVVYVEEK